MNLQLVPDTDPIFHTALEEFNFQNAPVNPEELARGLVEVMLASKIHALGISANQCGLPHRVFIMRANPFWACFNPKIVDVSEEQLALDEGCLSYPHLYIKIRRPARIRARFNDITGEVITQRFEGLSARVFQHELDHLNGIDFTQRAHKMHLQRALRQRKILLRKQKTNLDIFI